MRFARCQYGSWPSEYETLRAPLATAKSAERHFDRDADGKRKRDAERVAEADSEFHLRCIDVKDALPELPPFADGFVG